MPNLVAHIGFGLDCIGLEEDSIISNNLGSFLLGCCSPDVRIVTKLSRDRTHFVPISNKVIGTGKGKSKKNAEQMAAKAALLDAKS